MNLTVLSPMDNQQFVTESSSPQKYKPNFALWIAVGVATLAIGIGVGLAVGKYSSLTSSQISSYDDCLNAKGSIIQESYPATCVTAESQRFIQPIYTPTTTLTETTDPTANWKTYADNSLSFFLRYPPDWNSPNKNIIENKTEIQFTNRNARPIVLAGLTVATRMPPEFA